LQTAWRKYGHAYEESQKIFHECLEILVGLALRDKLLDEVCHIADELIKELTALALGSASLAVPAADEALDKTLARIVRVRFPDWTIWTLPFVIHEYAHVLIDENDGLRALTAEHASTLIAASNTLQQAYAEAGDDEEKRENVTRRATYPLRILIADAFATYSMGPAYAYTAILLRLDPLVLGETGGPPAHAKRAHVILEILRYISGKAGGQDPFRHAADDLSVRWQSLAKIAGADLPEPVEGSIESIAANLGPTLDFLFSIPGVKGMPYPYFDQVGFSDAADNGWNVAERWAEAWKNELENFGELDDLTEPGVTDKSKLRDVLNAAWLCVVEKPGHRGQIESVVKSTCDMIVEHRRVGPAGGRRRSGRARARASR
jgi:hypothetical protein